MEQKGKKLDKILMQIISKILFPLIPLIASPVVAQTSLEVIGKPVDGKLGFQPPATELAERLFWLDDILLIICIGIVVFVLGLLGYAIIRFNRKANPEPASFTHHTPLEIIWTVVPIIILVVIAVFSLPELFKQQKIPEGDVHIKATGYQWYWGYEYVDHGFQFESYLIGSPASLDEAIRPKDAEVRPYVLNNAMEEKLADYGYTKEEFLLATDTAVVVPVNKTVVMTITGGDVIHSWTIPAFGVKQDGVPGRLAQLWFKAEKEGIYFGQCSELCGKDHAYMPITVKVVKDEDYHEWLNNATKLYAGKDKPYRLAKAAN